MDNVHYLYRPSPLAGFIRVGHNDPARVSDLVASGQFQFQRLVFNASFIDGQRDLLRLAHASGFETVLDPNFGELGAIGKHGSSARNLPWAMPGRPWTPSDLTLARSAEVAKQIASFAATRGVRAVLSPSHLIESANDAWLARDKLLAENLRVELDRSGCNHVPVDYHLSVPFGVLCEAGFSDEVLRVLRDLPIGALWLRIGNFGSDASPGKIRAFIESVRNFHQLEVPIVSDHLGGFAGLSSMAFGAVSGICHGTEFWERFDLGSWRNVSSSAGGGSKPRVYFWQLDRRFSQEEAREILGVRNAKGRLGCIDQKCCPQGIDDMIENPIVHFLNQRGAQIESLSNTTEPRRPDHFITRSLEPAIQSARWIARLGQDLPVAEHLIKGADRLIKLHAALREIQKITAPTAAPALLLRTGAGTVVPMTKR